jgi:hypothetical protein
MELLVKVDRLKELKREVKSLTKEMQTDMFGYVLQEFRKRGFVTDPRNDGRERSLYNPVDKVSIHIGNITQNSVSISVSDMINDGMNWGSAYNKIYFQSGKTILFNYLKVDFDKFYDKVYQKRANLLNEILAD